MKNKSGYFCSEIPPLADFLMLLISLLFKKGFRDVYYVPEPNRVTMPLSTGWKEEDKLNRKNSGNQSSVKKFIQFTKW